MDRWLVLLIFAAFTYVPTYSYGQDGGGGNGAYRLKSYEWQPREMNSRMGGKIEAELKPGSWFCGFVKDCKFDLHYFFNRWYDGPAPGRKYNPENKKPWILYIAGGPGEIVDRVTSDLNFLDSRANVVYFDVRGTGFSVIPESNDYDPFLRADYVVEDIETLRKTLLNECWDLGKLNCEQGITPWSAIYAHSWGTIVAQKYAARYPKMVKKLILSAPVSRGHLDTEQARRKMIVDNLFDILDKHRTKTCSWNRDDPVTLEEIPKDTRVPGVENFCFLRDERKVTNEEVTPWNEQAILIRKNFTELLNSIEKEYGSVNLAISFYDQFKADSNFWGKYRYYRPEFFDAIRELEDFGAGVQHGLRLDDSSRSQKVETAMFLAYYLSLPEEALRNERHRSNPGKDPNFFECNSHAPFLTGYQSLKYLKYWSRIIATEFRRPGNIYTTKGNNRCSINQRVHGRYLVCTMVWHGGFSK